MAELNQLGSYSEYTDGSLVQVPGPDSTKFGYQFDKQQRTFFQREVSLIFSGKHGSTHVSTDPIPAATCTTPGLLSSEDKCRLDQLIGTRLGVLGFQGAGFPDDGGFMQGDIILAAGSEMISIERVGNVIRFVVDVPAIFTCGNEDCLQMYWVQDETDISAIRPPITGGRLMGVNSYGEFKCYILPENTVVNPANPSATLNNKGFYPSFIFKRYDDGTGINEAEIDLVLKRNESGTAIVGWGFTPGATGKPEWQVFLGVDDDGSRLAFKLDAPTAAGVLGTLYYNGVSITKRPAIVTAYDASVITSNGYRAKWWDVQGKATIGDAFAVINQANWDLSNDIQVLDAANDSLLSIGQIIDVFSIQVGTANGNPIYVHYCREQPTLNAQSLWTTLGSIQFGDTLTSTDGAAGEATVDDLRTFDSSQWGIDGLKDVTLLNSGTPIALNSAYGATLDTGVPALVVSDDPGTAGELRRPVTVWHRANLRDAYLELHFARPDAVDDFVFPPVDLLLRAPIDTLEVKYAAVASSDTIAAGDYIGKTYIVLSGVRSDEVPSRGLIRTVDGDNYGNSYAYVAVYRHTDGSAALVMSSTAPTVSDNIEFLHEEYKSPALRLAFEFNGDHDISLQPQVGILSPSSPYGGDASENDRVGALDDGYAVGITHWQDGATSAGTTGITVNPEGFVIYNGAILGGDEIFNVLRVLVVDQKVWIWWNDLLMAPSAADSALLSSPVDISTPYYPISDIVQYGKFGVRLFPGAKLRRFIIRSHPTKFSEFSLGQLEVS